MHDTTIQLMHYGRAWHQTHWSTLFYTYTIHPLGISMRFHSQDNFISLQEFFIICNNFDKIISMTE